jgi:hypothetical protein
LSDLFVGVFHTHTHILDELIGIDICIADDLSFCGLPFHSLKWFFLFLLFLILEFELRASCLLGRHSTLQAMPPALFALVSFGNRVLPFAQAGLD